MALPRLSKLAADYGGDILLPVTTLLAGGSKAMALFQLLGGILVTKVLGPLGAIAGLVVGISSALINWARSSELVGQAMERAAAKDALVKQFAEITKSVSVAKASLQDLFSFASKAPFNFDSVLEGGKQLGLLSKNALLTRSNLTLVGDVAAASGQKFSTSAEAIGELYNDLQEGRPARKSAEALRDMGVISQTTVDRIESLQQAGAGLTTTWMAARAALADSSGAMAGLSQTVEDLQGKREQTKAGILAPAGKILNDSEKVGVQAGNDLLEKAAPTLTTLAQIIARVVAGLGYLQNGFVRIIAAIPGLSEALGALTAAFSAFALTAIAVSTGKLAAFFFSSAKSAGTYANAVRDATAATRALTEATVLQAEVDRVASGAFGPAISPTFAAESGSRAAAQQANIKLQVGGRSIRGGLSTIFEGAKTAFNEAARAPAASGPMGYGSELPVGMARKAIGPALPPGFISRVVSTGAKEATVGGEAVAMGAGAKVAYGAVRLLGEGVAYLGKGLAGLFTGFGLSVGILATVAVSAAVLANQYLSARTAIKDFNDATAASSAQLKKQTADIRNAADQAAVYQKAMALVKTGQEELASAHSDTQSGWWGGFMNMIHGIPNRMEAGNKAVEEGMKIQAEAKAKASTLAITDEQNQEVLDQRLTQEKSARNQDLVGVTPEKRLEILQTRATVARTELAKKNAAQMSLAVQTLTVPQQAAMDSRPEDEQKAIADAQAEKDSANKDTLRVATRAETMRKGQTGIDPRKARIQAANAALKGAQDRAANNESLRNSVTTAQTSTMTGGGEEMTAQAAVIEATKSGNGRAIQQAQNNLQSVRAKFADLNQSLAAAPAEEKQQTLANQRAAAEAPLIEREGQAAAGAPLTPEEDVSKTEKDIADKKALVDLSQKAGSITATEAVNQKKALDNELAGRKQSVKYREDQAVFSKKDQDIAQSTLELDSDAVGIARDHWGAIQNQVSALEARGDLTKTERANAIQLLKISQEQAAMEVYRGDVARKLASERAAANLVDLKGDVVKSREMRNQADMQEADVIERARTADLTAKNIAAGINPADAAQKAAADAATERAQDALQSGLEKIRNQADVVASPAGARGPSMEALLNNDQKRALRDNGFNFGSTASGKSGSRSHHYGVGGQFGSVENPDVNPINSTTATWESARLETATTPDLPAMGGAVPGSDPLLKVNQDQLSILTDIKAILGASGSGKKDIY